MSFAFTLTESTSLFTRDTSPFLQASNSSLKAPLVPQPLPPGLALPESGVEPALLPPPVVDELVLLGLVVVLLLLVLSSGAEVSGVISGSPTLSDSAPAAGPPVSGGDSEGVSGLDPGLGGEDKFCCCCCCCCCWEVRRDVAIFAHRSPSGSKKKSGGELPGSVRVKLPVSKIKI